MRTRFGAHCHSWHAGQLAQPFAKLVDHFQRALNSLNRLKWVNIGKALHPGDALIEARIMLHRARTERKQAEIDRIIHARKTRIVTYGLRFGQARQADGPIALQPAQPLLGIGPFVKINAGLFGRADLEDQRLIEHQRAIAGECVGRALRLLRLARAALIVHAHAASPWPSASIAACSASANRSTSASLVVSVTAITRPLASSASPG